MAEKNTGIIFTEQEVQELINFIAVCTSGLNFRETARISNNLYNKLGAAKNEQNDTHDSGKAK